jgi:hypothetical protein
VMTVVGLRVAAIQPAQHYEVTARVRCRSSRSSARRPKDTVERRGAS